MRMDQQKALPLMTSRNGPAQFQPQQEALLSHAKLAANYYFFSS